MLRQSLPGVDQPTAPTTTRLGWTAVGRTVILLGITSLLTDISAEMVSAVLPLFVLYQLQATPLQLGIVDGIYQGCSGLVRLAAGVVSDRWRRQKDVAAAGYALSALSRIGLLASSGALGGIATFVLVDRVGKGIRTAPRDALISLSVPRERLGLAFGVHRSLDTGGALLGPLFAFGLLALAQNAFDIVFLASFAFALIGLSVIGLFVENREVRSPTASVSLAMADCIRLLRVPRFRVLIIAAGMLALFTVSDAFIYIGLQRRGSLAMDIFPLLYVGTALFYLLLALPAGRLADRVGRRRMYLAGQLLMFAVYGVLLLQGPTWMSALALPLLGGYYACTDGVLMALASSELDERLRTSGLALLTTVTSLASLASSILIGTLWTIGGMDTAFRFVAVAFPLALAIGVLAAFSARRHPTCP